LSIKKKESPRIILAKEGLTDVEKGLKNKKLFQKPLLVNRTCSFFFIDEI